MESERFIADRKAHINLPAKGDALSPTADPKSATLDSITTDEETTLQLLIHAQPIFSSKGAITGSSMRRFGDQGLCSGVSKVSSTVFSFNPFSILQEVDQSFEEYNYQINPEEGCSNAEHHKQSKSNSQNRSGLPYESFEGSAQMTKSSRHNSSASSGVRKLDISSSMNSRQPRAPRGHGKGGDDVLGGTEAPSTRNLQSSPCNKDNSRPRRDDRSHDSGAGVRLGSDPSRPTRGTSENVGALTVGDYADKTPAPRTALPRDRSKNRPPQEGRRDAESPEVKVLTVGEEEECSETDTDELQSQTTNGDKGTRRQVWSKIEVHIRQPSTTSSEGLRMKHSRSFASISEVYSHSSSADSTSASKEQLQTTKCRSKDDYYLKWSSTNEAEIGRNVQGWKEERRERRRKTDEDEESDDLAWEEPTADHPLAPRMSSRSKTMPTQERHRASPAVQISQSTSSRPQKQNRDLPAPTLHSRPTVSSSTQPVSRSTPASTTEFRRKQVPPPKTTNEKSQNSRGILKTVLQATGLSSSSQKCSNCGWKDDELRRRLENTKIEHRKVLLRLDTDFRQELEKREAAHKKAFQRATMEYQKAFETSEESFRAAKDALQGVISKNEERLQQLTRENDSNLAELSKVNAEVVNLRESRQAEAEKYQQDVKTLQATILQRKTDLVYTTDDPTIKHKYKDICRKVSAFFKTLIRFDSTSDVHFEVSTLLAHDPFVNYMHEFLPNQKTGLLICHLLNLRSRREKQPALLYEIVTGVLMNILVEEIFERPLRVFDEELQVSFSKLFKMVKDFNDDDPDRLASTMIWRADLFRMLRRASQASIEGEEFPVEHKPKFVLAAVSKRIEEILSPMFRNFKTASVSEHEFKSKTVKGLENIIELALSLMATLATQRAEYCFERSTNKPVSSEDADSQNDGVESCPGFIVFPALKKRGNESARNYRECATICAAKIVRLTAEDIDEVFTGVKIDLVEEEILRKTFPVSHKILLPTPEVISELRNLLGADLPERKPPNLRAGHEEILAPEPPSPRDDQGGAEYSHLPLESRSIMENPYRSHSSNDEYIKDAHDLIPRSYHEDSARHTGVNASKGHGNAQPQAYEEVVGRRTPIMRNAATGYVPLHHSTIEVDPQADGSGLTDALMTDVD